MERSRAAEIVAVAIVAASKETGVDPIRVASGGKDVIGERMKYETSRARAYAALALRTLDYWGSLCIGRMVGASSVEAYLSALQARLATGGLKWWNQEAMDRVVAAVGAAHMGNLPAPAATPAPGPKVAQAGSAGPAFRLPRPVLPGKRALLEELRQAVQNTARMGVPE